jgi:predicted alpha-1,2-mannosidase
MNPFFMRRFFMLFLTAGTALAQGPVRYVNPLIGTAPSTTESARRHSEAGSELRGQIAPLVGYPHGMTAWTPQTQATETKCVSPYYFNDTRLSGFRGTHWLNGSCVQDYGSVTMMPVAGPLRLRPADRATPFRHEEETATPMGYRVELPEPQIRAELAATQRAALLRFTFGRGGESHVLVEPNSDEGQGFVEIHPERNEIVGYNPVHRIYQGAGQPAGFSGYFVVQFDTPFTASGTWLDYAPQPGTRSAQGTGNRRSVGAYATWSARPGQVVRARVGTSFTSLEGARRNLAAEVPDWNLERVRAGAETAWNTELGRMQARGTADDLQKFYTALYHTKHTPRLFSDVDGRYPGFAGTPEQRAEGFDYYCDFSLWDTFRAAMPLHTLLEPTRTGHFAQSLVKKAEQGGWMPIFPCWNSYTAAMIGDHAQSFLADAYGKGVRNFDVATAYRYLRRNAFEANPDPASYAAGQGRRAMGSYLRYGYVPLEDSVWQAFHKREQVSRTLEYAYDDFCLGQLARALGHVADAEVLARRARNYEHVIDSATGYARGRYADGRWVARFDPFAVRASYICEGSPAQYTYFVPHDVSGLIARLGGRARFVAKLDTLFGGGHYWHGNEPNNQIAYLYALAGAPWKTQARVRQLITDEYSTGPGGLSGNEDGGQMSAWLVFSMAGLYPVCPGTPYYVLGSPALETVSLRLANGKTFTIRTEGQGPEHVYIQSATLNGAPFTKTYLSHAQLQAGGTLTLRLGTRPNPGWGATAADVPPQNAR